MKVNELTGPTLDWAVAKCEEFTLPDGNIFFKDGVLVCRVLKRPWEYYNPSTNWVQGGLIIERELNNLFKWNKINQDEPDIWCAVHHRRTPDGTFVIQQDGPTALIAAMRCYVSSKLGNEINVPEELL